MVQRNRWTSGLGRPGRSGVRRSVDSGSLTGENEDPGLSFIVVTEVGPLRVRKGCKVGSGRPGVGTPAQGAPQGPMVPTKGSTGLGTGVRD